MLEEVEKEEKMKILSVFGMSKSVQKWKNHLWGRLAHTLTSFQNHFQVNGPEDEPEPEGDEDPEVEEDKTAAGPAATE